MRRRERLCLLLAAGLSLGVHAAAAIWFSHLSPSLDGLNQPPTRIVQLSVVTPRTSLPATVPELPPEAAATPAKRVPPPRPAPRPSPVPRRVQPERALPPPEPETVASLPVEPVKSAQQDSPEVQQAVSSAATSAAAESYLARLLAHIDSHKFYPRSARRRGQEGDVHVTFYLLQDGGIRALDISGGSRQLREATKRAVQDSLPLPLPPASIKLHEQVSFSMQFRLKG
jgi:protein TonB